jgi:hypothetical protein
MTDHEILYYQEYEETQAAKERVTSLLEILKSKNKPE